MMRVKSYPSEKGHIKFGEFLGIYPGEHGDESIVRWDGPDSTGLYLAGLHSSKIRQADDREYCTCGHCVSRMAEQAAHPEKEEHWNIEEWNGKEWETRAMMFRSEREAAIEARNLLGESGWRTVRSQLPTVEEEEKENAPKWHIVKTEDLSMADDPCILPNSRGR